MLTVGSFLLSGVFLLTVDNFSFLLTVGVFLLTVLVFVSLTLTVCILGAL